MGWLSGWAKRIKGTLGSQDADSVNITGGSISGITDLAIADAGTFSTAADAVDLLSIYYDGSSYYYQLSKGWT